MPDTLPTVGRIIAVASGKGGVGKTTVTVSLALALSRRGLRVGLFDADVYGPNVPLLLGIRQTRSTNALMAVARADANSAPYIAPMERFGLKVMSIGLLVAERDAVLPDPQQVARIVDRTLRDVVWGELDYLLLDLPPGTGEPQQSLVRSLQIDGVVMVTTPQDLAQLDATRSLGLYRQANVPILGVVENMSYMTCPHCGERVDVFHRSDRPWEVRAGGLPLLGTLPLNIDISRAVDAGHPLVGGDAGSEVAKPFADIGAQLVELLPPLPRASELNEALIARMKRIGNLTSPTVEAAFRAVPRHAFLPDLPREQVYADDAIPTKRLASGEPISSSSQPSIMAIMLEQLEPEPGQNTLEIGAGTGYNAALLSHLVGPRGRVTTVDIDEDTVAAARDHLRAAGHGRVRVVQADGAQGYAAGAPYDRIILTVGAWDIAPAWREQLAPGGRLVLPLALNGPQLAVAFERRGDVLESRSLAVCGFMRLRGPFAGPERRLLLGPEGALSLHHEGDAPASAAAIAQWLGEPAQVADAGSLRGGETFALWLWLALHEPRFGQLFADHDALPLEEALHIFGDGQARMGWIGLPALVGQRGLGLLVAHSPAPSDERGPQAPLSLSVRSFGEIEPAQRLLDLVRSWHDAGRPDEGRLHLRAYPAEAGYKPAPGEIALRKRWSLIVAAYR
jgi:protein-L-isoaspartate(D-aspartate) O-methyltransferase